jgi:hypothetical protein
MLANRGTQAVGPSCAIGHSSAIITIECQREKHRNIEGHNLEGEFDSLTPV